MDTAVLTLLKNLKNENSNICIDSLKKLAELKDKESAEEISCLLCHNEAQVRSQCAHTLGQIGSRKVLNKLMEVLEEEESSTVQSAILGALATIGGKGVSRKLREILVNPASYLHKSLITALSVWTKEDKGQRSPAREYEEELFELSEMAEYPWKSMLVGIAQGLPSKKAEEYLLNVVINNHHCLN